MELARLLRVPAFLSGVVGNHSASGSDGSQSAKGAHPLATGDRGLESVSLQRRVSNKPFRRWASMEPGRAHLNGF